ncbi:MAG: hypothetical protein IEMM0003_0684 [bacterium]|nr:MAG: hypothetical protein IEMM0003_0684 [bacterium]
MKKQVSIISFVGYHNSGKTTLLLKVVDELISRNLSVGVIKHDPKGKARIDEGKKDSALFYQRGAKEVALISPDFSAIKIRGSQNLKKIAALFDDVDIILAEGFKSDSNISKIWVESAEDQLSDLNKMNPIIALIGNDDHKFNCPVYRQDQIAEIAELIMEYVSKV